MMSLDTIKALNAEIGQKAARAKRVPYVIGSQAEIDAYESLPFPNLGGYVPPGWREVTRYFVDKSGRGDRYAMGLADLKEMLRPGRAYAVAEEGPFQAYIGEFEWVPAPGADAGSVLPADDESAARAVLGGRDR